MPEENFGWSAALGRHLQLIWLYNIMRIPYVLYWFYFFSRAVEGWTNFGWMKGTCSSRADKSHLVLVVVVVVVLVVGLYTRFVPGAARSYVLFVDSLHHHSSRSLEVYAFLPFFGSAGLIIYFCFIAAAVAIPPSTRHRRHHLNTPPECR